MTFTRWSIVLISFLAGANAYSQHKLTVTISNIQSNDGELYVGLFNDEDKFPEKDKTYKYVIVQAVKGSVSVSFDVPDGSYAISVFHDANENGLLDTNFLGAPSEYYGFSNNARSLFSAPKFKDCVISCTDDKDIKIELH